MACSKGTVTHGAGTINIYTCVDTTSTGVNVTLEGEADQSWGFQGYVKVKLVRASETSEAWLDVTTKNGGYWDNSSKGNKNITISNVGYKGAIMRAIPEFYTDSSYRTKLSSTGSHMFVR
jgi:hypothetical protein